MADIDLKTATPDTTLPTTGFLFGADSQASASPSVYSTQTVATTLLGSTSLTGATVTADSPVLNLAQTWNNAAVTFTGLKFNVPTDSSASGSLLMDLQVGGSSKFKVGKGGALTINGSTLVDNGGYLYFGTATSTAGVMIDQTVTGAINLASGSGVKFYSATISGSPDLFLTRRGAANLRFGAADAAAPVAQTLSVQSVVAGTTNTAGANLTITGSQGTGNAAGGSIIFQVAPAGSSGSAQNALATALTINADRSATFAAAVNAGTSFVDANNYAIVGAARGAGGINIGSLGQISFCDNANTQSGTVDVLLRRDAANTLALRNGANAQLLRVYARYDGTNDAYGAMGAAVNLDGTAGDANTLYVGSQKKGSPTALTKLAVQVDGTTRLDYNISNANQLFIHGTFQSGGSFFSGADVRAAVTGSIYWNGRTNITAPADGNLLIGNLAQTDFGRMMFGGTTSSFPALKRNSTALETKLADDSAYAPHAMQYLDVTDGITAPASATGRARIYVDTADGDLKVIFADGTVKTIVTDT